MNRKRFLPLLGLFIAVTSFANLFRGFLSGKGIDADVLVIGNALIFLISLLSLYFHIKGFLDKNVQVFLRSVYGSLMIKMFGLAAIAAVYILVMKKEVNKPALFICMGLYVLYTIIEIRQVFHLLKEKKNNG
ncbi:hypothetical protein PDL71_09020 [Lacibacter sp. MH-610]|uniref:hypothetical protein n=1 Tax=Lacibacter sp. MH-610 TaxID=3020883 RepID=UPI003891C1EC